MELLQAEVLVVPCFMRMEPLEWVVHERNAQVCTVDRSGRQGSLPVAYGLGSLGVTGWGLCHGSPSASSRPASGGPQLRGA